MSHPDQPDSHDEQSPDQFSGLGLFVKLILLPGSLVLVLVLIAVIFGWLTLSPGDVHWLVEKLSSDGNARWRAAVNLAGMLADPGNAELRSDPVLAARLVELLENEIQSAGMQQDQITLRMYLCRALGEFCIADPLPVLLEAAKTERDQREVDVRRSAIEAIAVLADNVGPVKLRSQPDLIPVLMQTSRDKRPSVRSATAFTLGILGGSQAEARLEKMLLDGYPDVRYNAATGLARGGNATVVEVLLEMLDPQQSAGIEVEKQGPARGSKRAMILVNALRATSQLASANPTGDLSRLGEAVEKLSQAEVDRQIRLQAIQVLSQLKGHPGPAWPKGEPRIGGERPGSR